MKRSYLYITLLLVVLILGSCKIGKSYVRPELNLPIVWRNIRTA